MLDRIVPIKHQQVTRKTQVNAWGNLISAILLIPDEQERMETLEIAARLAAHMGVAYLFLQAIRERTGEIWAIRYENPFGKPITMTPPP